MVTSSKVGRAEVMRASPVTEAMLVKFSIVESQHQVTVQSSGDLLELSSNTKSKLCPIFSVVDSNGMIVRSIHKWLSHLRRQVGLSFSIGTVEQYGRTLSYVCRWIEKAPPYPNLDLEGNIKLLSRFDVVSCMDSMSKDGAGSKKTLHTREACLRQFLDWLSTLEGGRIRDSENSPWGRDGTLPYVMATPTALSPKFIATETIVAVLGGMHNECERCMFHAQYDMGLRISEITNFRIIDIPNDNLYDPSFEFIPVCVSGVKGRGGQRKERITLISRAVLRRIKHYHSSLEYRLAPDWDINDKNKPAFLTVNQARWGLRNASKQFKTSVRRVGLSDEMTNHWLRHGTAFSVLRSDIGKTYQQRMLIIQQMLGHNNLKTVEIYTQISPALLEQLTRAGKKINRLEEAEFIRGETYLGPLQHKEKRGHRD